MLIKELTGYEAMNIMYWKYQGMIFDRTFRYTIFTYDRLLDLFCDRWSYLSLQAQNEQTA